MEDQTEVGLVGNNQYISVINASKEKQIKQDLERSPCTDGRTVVGIKVHDSRQLFTAVYLLTPAGVSELV